MLKLSFGLTCIHVTSLSQRICHSPRYTRLLGMVIWPYHPDFSSPNINRFEVAHEHFHQHRESDGTISSNIVTSVIDDI